jgi:hypothetical protein
MAWLARGLAAASKSMARVEVVPWSIARRYFPSLGM